MNHRKVSKYCKACLIMYSVCMGGALIFESKELMLVSLVFFIGAACLDESMVTTNDNTTRMKSNRLVL